MSKHVCFRSPFSLKERIIFKNYFFEAMLVTDFQCPLTPATSQGIFFVLYNLLIFLER